jgi:NTP pyrophosphatase (non-canonical NTP hydrolase)
MLKVYGDRDKRRGAEGTFIWLVEEIGELSEALRKRDKPGMEEELADVFAWLLSLANVLEIDLNGSFRSKYRSSCPCCESTPCKCDN